LWRFKLRKTFLAISIILLIGALVYNEVYSSNTGLGTVPPCNMPQQCYWSVPNGLVSPLSSGSYNGAYSVNSNSTMDFDVAGKEPQEPLTGLSYYINTTGTTTIVFRNNIIPTVTCNCSFSFTSSSTILTFSNGLSLSQFTLVWGLGSVSLEQPRVLFLDDFLTGTVADQGWIIDLYKSPATPPGPYTTAGYLGMVARSTSSVETVHVINPAFTPSSYTGQNIIVKRKLTFALYPFTMKSSTLLSDIRLGMSPLISSSQAYPGSHPNGTPFVDDGNNCSSPTLTDGIGSDFVEIQNTGYVYVVTCGDGGFNRSALYSGSLDPTLYTVATVETYGAFCSFCTDNIHPGIAWVWFRVYQEDNSGNVITSADKNLNFTTNIAPYYQKTYIFSSQTNNDGAASNEQTFIDLVQMQNYGSPVCLFGCIPPPNLVGISPFGSIWASIVSLCQWMGLGNLSMGAFFLFALLNGIVEGFTFAIGIKYGQGAPTYVMLAEFVGLSAIFLTSGLMGSIWIFAILVTDVVVALFTFNTVFLKGGRNIGGGV